MALVLKDRVLELSTTVGTGTLTLNGAVSDFQTFSSAIGNGNTTYYTIVDDNANQWEVGIGTVGAGTLSRNTVYASSNGGSLVNFSANAKQVFCDYPASKSVYTDASGNISNLAGSISKPTFIEFDQTYSTALSAGQLGWDGNNTLALGMAGGNVVQHIGEDSFFYIKASSAITKGQLIMFTGAVGASGVLTGAPSTGVTIGSYIMGVAAEDIANNGFGLVQCFGELTGVNTNAFNEGDILYYNSSVTGGLTSTFPTSGPIVIVAAVAKKSASGGVIYIRVSVTQRITAGTGISVSQSTTGTTITNTSPSSGGTVTSVGGTGTVSGISLSGTVTSSGNLTLGGALDLSSPPAIGATTPAAGTFTTITGQTEVLNGTGSNLLLYSEQFQQANWSTISTTVTANTQIAPDGNLTADTLTGSSGSSRIYQAISPYPTTNSTWTFSVYLKAASNVTARIGIGSATIREILTQNVSVTTSWQRFSITATGLSTDTGNLQVSIYCSDGTSGNTIYSWGAQAERASTVGAYVATTTTAVYGTPSLSFSGVAGLGLQSDGSLYVSPAGTGAIQAQATTSSATGGNARGANAVDWQTSRGAASQVASGQLSVIGGGINNVASQYNSSIVCGFGNSSTGIANFIGSGSSNTGSGSYSAIVGGVSNTSAGLYNFIGGGFTNSGTANAAVTTQSGTMNGTTAVTLSGSNANIKVGQYITGTSIAADTYVAAISGISLTLSKNASGSSTSTLSFFTPHGVVVGGGNNQATGAYSFIGGGGDAGTATNRNVASGDWSVVCGGFRNTASGFGSFIGTNNNQAGTNTASGSGSVVLSGTNNNSTANATSVLWGYGNLANSNFSSANGVSASTRGITGAFSIAPCNSPLSTSYSNQTTFLILARQTTDATPTVLTCDTSAAGTGNQVILPNNSAYYFTGEVVSGVTGGGNSKGWEISGLIKRGANAAATTLVGSTVTSLYADAGAATWTIALAADTTNGGLKVTFTGQAGTTIRTVCQIRTTEMTY